MDATARRAQDLDPRDRDFLARLPAHVRDRLSGIARRAQFSPGTEILSEGIDTPFLGAVEAGRVALRLRVPERGGRLTFLTIDAGELLGWSALVAPYRATADAVAIDETEILALDASALRNLLASDCDVAAALLPLVLETVSSRLGASWHQLTDMFGPGAIEPW